MHIPGHMINGSVPAVSAVLSSAALVASARLSIKTAEKPSAGRFAAVTALIFAAQMMNFPVQSGTSGHLIGATLAVMFLGIPFSVLSMSIVLTIQCLIFADGALSALGANILNMAVLAVIPGALVKHFILDKSRVSGMVKNIFTAFSAWLSVLFASTACSIELSLSGTIPFSSVFPAMTSVHAVIGVGEALITVLAVVLLLKPVEAEKRIKKDYLAILSASAVIALFLSPFASSYPDGLEWVAEKYSFFHESMPPFVSPMPDYSISFFSSEILSTSFAGITGTLLTFLLTFLIGIALKTKAEA